MNLATAISRSKKLVTIILLLIASYSFSQTSDKIKMGGFVDTYHAVRAESPNDFLASRTRFRGEIHKLNGNSYFFTSFNAIYNNVLPELTQISFREAYLEYTQSNWGFKVGRQIIIWGKADGVRITDIISPMDLTEFLAQDYDDIRMPVNAIVFNKFNNNWDLDIICVPVFESYILPGENNPWEINFGDNLILDEAEIPETKLANVEYGGKLSFYLSGIDFDISALHTWNKEPVYSYYLDADDTFHLKPEHHRLGFVGFGVSKSLSAFVLRAESAFYFGKKFSPAISNYTDGLIEKNSINYLVGIDYYPGYEWSITAQFSEEYILDYSNNINNEEHTYISTIGISKKVLRSTLALSSFAYIGLQEGDFFNRTSATYTLSDNIQIAGGIDWFHGDEGIFGQYKNNTEIFIKAKYNF